MFKDNKIIKSEHKISAHDFIHIRHMLTILILTEYKTVLEFNKKNFHKNFNNLNTIDTKVSTCNTF